MEQKKQMNQRGSVTSLVRSIRRTEEYEAWKRAVFIRDRFTCQQCGVRNGRKRVIEAHHVVELSTLVRMKGVSSVEDAKQCLVLWDTGNGQTLCHSCHQLTDSYPKNFVKKPKKRKRKNV